MKRLFTLFTGLCVMLLAGCNDEYDDSALVKRLDDFEQRLERLERLCNDINTNLGSMQTIVTALDRGDLDWREIVNPKSDYNRRRRPKIN